MTANTVIGFENEADAWKVLEALRKRFARYGLRLHAEKTRVVPFARPDRTTKNGKARATFDFLGFTEYGEIEGYLRVGQMGPIK